MWLVSRILKSKCTDFIVRTKRKGFSSVVPCTCFYPKSTARNPLLELLRCAPRAPESPLPDAKRVNGLENITSGAAKMLNPKSTENAEIEAVHFQNFSNQTQVGFESESSLRMTAECCAREPTADCVTVRYGEARCGCVIVTKGSSAGRWLEGKSKAKSDGRNSSGFRNLPYQTTATRSVTNPDCTVEAHQQAVLRCSRVAFNAHQRYGRRPRASRRARGERYLTLSPGSATSAAVGAGVPQ